MIESGDISLITGISGTVTRDDRCVGIAIKCSTHKSRVFSLLFRDFKA